MKKRQMTLRKITNGYVINHANVMLVRPGSGTYEERIIFQGTMLELRDIYFENGWSKYKVELVYSEWGNFKGLVFVIEK